VGDAAALAIWAGIAALFARAPEPTPHPSREPGAQIAPTTPTKPTPLDPPPPRAPIASLRGFESRSRLEYVSQPGRVHELRAAYVFPDRVRWWISAPDGAGEERRLRYRLGRHVLAVEPRQSGSVEYVAEDRDALIAAFELRRALFLYPDGFEWKGEPLERRATLANGDVLTAKLAGEPTRPVRLDLRTESGEFRDSFRAITWRTEGARHWPVSFEVWNSETLAWRETVDAIDVDTRFLDSFFVPPDRRGVVGTPVVGVRDLDIPPVCLRRIELAAGSTWDAARAEHARVSEAHAQTSALALETFVTLEIASDGQPRAILLRLARMPSVIPEGFQVLPERIGAATSVRGLGAVTVEALARVSGRLPAGSTPGTAYVRFDSAKSDGDIVVIVPAQ